MTRPWLITLSPFVIPCDARSELMRIAEGLTPAEFSDKVWAKRVEAAPAVPKSHKRNWPITRIESNVVAMTKKRART